MRVMPIVAPSSRPAFAACVAALQASAVMACLAFGIVRPAVAQCNQQVAALLGTGGSGNGHFGYGMASSATGDTVAVGAPSDSGSVGAAYVFVRTGETWAQQGPKLTPTGGIGAGFFGVSVALSADGNTLLVGAYQDNNNIGAAYVFQRDQGVWSQQGPKLVAADGSGQAQFGGSVSLSSDGNTALIGAGLDGNPMFSGAAYAFVRTGQTWAQQGAKMQPTGASGNGNFGSSVALSADGGTALIGAPNDGGQQGAAYVFARDGSLWSQQGPKLLGVGGVGAGQFGGRVALSADASTALVAAFSDNSVTGAAYVFVASGGAWAQQGQKLIPHFCPAERRFGFSLALSLNGDRALIGADVEDAGVGAAYAFERVAAVWSPVGLRMVPDGGASLAGFGVAVAVTASGDQAFIGAHGESGGVGKAYVFDIGAPGVCPPPCSGDVNCDCALDGFDVEGQEKAVGGDTADYCQPNPDFNGDFALDGFDVEAVELVVGGGPCP